MRGFQGMLFRWPVLEKFQTCSMQGYKIITNGRNFQRS